MAAIIFDVDGTLAETEELHRRAFNAAFRSRGLPWRWSPALYRDLLSVTGGKERIRHYLSVYRAGTTDATLSEDLIGQLHREKTQHFVAALGQGTLPLRPGVVRLLKEAAETGLSAAIATTTSLANVEALLQAALAPGGIARFDVVCAGDDVPEKKPAPDVYHLALKRLGLAAAQCVALEDSYNGLCAARAAGLTTVVTQSRFTAGQDFTGASLVVDHLGAPGSPCRVSQGFAPAATLVDVALLSQALDRAAAENFPDWQRI